MRDECMGDLTGDQQRAMARTKEKRKMTSKGRIVAMLAALALLGCKGVQPTSAASGGDAGVVASNGDGSGAVSGAGADSGATRTEYIKDPTLNNMNAQSVVIPASWRFQGVMVPKNPCTNDISKVWRATSPDGHSFVELMPRVGWKWGRLPGDSGSQDGCLPLNQPVSAPQFVRFMANLLHVEYLADVPVPGQAGGGGVQTRVGLYTKALGTVRFSNGSTKMNGLLRVDLTCTHPAPMGTPGAQSWAGGSGTGQAPSAGRCTAVVGYLTAPESQFDSVKQLWSGPEMGPQKELADWVAISSKRYNDQTQALTKQFDDESNAAFAMRQQAYKDQAAAQQKEHEEFLDTMQRGTDISINNTQRAMNARGTAASDWVDYSLDRKTIMDTNTGAIYKTSNQVTPGGAAVQVHGDGTPIH
jgi:hypothetical protein